MKKLEDTWNPQQYQKFSSERNLPFYDLLQLITPQGNMSIVDLGCGTGALTKILHEKLHAKKTIGIDSSASMLKESLNSKSKNLQFKQTSVEEFKPEEKYDLIFSNAALQWVENHDQLFQRLAQYLTPTGQLAIQMPANFDFPTHVIAKELASEKPFSAFIDSKKPYPAVLSIEDYARLLYKLDFKNQLVRLQVYPHQLDSTESIIEWMKGSLLSYYRGLFPHEVYQQFLQIYTQRVLRNLGHHSSFFMPFKRILIWAQK